MNLGRTLMSLLMGWRKATATGPAPSTLLNDLVSYWPLDEISGTRVDAVGDNDLTDNNTVTSKARGPIGASAKFVAANFEYLSKSTLSVGTTNSLSIWFNSALAGTEGIFILGDNYATNAKLDAYVAANGSLVVEVNGATAIKSYAAGTIIANTWNHLYVEYDEATTKGGCSLNGGEFFQSATTVRQDPATLFLGSLRTNQYWLGGLMGCVGLWNRVLTAAERTATFASGNGLRYSDLPADLLTNLVSYWDLNEPSGVRYDSHGSNDLTDNNTVLNTSTGPLGLVASPVKANSETLSVNDTADLSGGAGKSYTFSLWVKPATVAGASDHGIFCKGTASTASLLEYFLEQYEDDLYWYVGNATTASYATKAAKIAAGVWAHIICGFDASTGKGFLSVDNDAQTLSGQLPGDAMLDGTGAFAIGRYGTNVYWGGQIATFGVWSRVLTADERTSLYNGGRGVRHAELPAGLTSGIVSYWDLNEASGVRYDSAGVNNLTDNNTVLSTINAGDAADGVTAIFVAANSESLSRADTTGTFGSGVSQTFSFWWKDTTAGATNGSIIARDNATTREWAIYTGNTVLYFLAFDSGGNPYTLDSFGDFVDTFAKNVWHHGLVWYDVSDGKQYYQVDGGTVRSKVGINYIKAGTGPLQIGASTYYAAADLTIDELAIWSRVLTADERAELFALGRGKYYDFS